MSTSTCNPSCAPRRDLREIKEEVLRINEWVMRTIIRGVMAHGPGVDLDSLFPVPEEG